MQYTVKNNRVEITVDTLGAELVSVKVDGKERLWQNESGAWAGHAPLLFPVCGRSAVVKNGEKYILGLHGFARKTQFVFKEQGEDFISFALSSFLPALQSLSIRLTAKSMPLSPSITANMTVAISP